MHPNAKDWDKRNGIPDTSWPNGKNLAVRITPKGRPCDWCGEPVPAGWIHEACAAKERDHYNDIFW